MSAWMLLALGLGVGFVLGISVSVYAAVRLWRIGQRVVAAKEAATAKPAEAPAKPATQTDVIWFAQSRGEQ